MLCVFCLAMWVMNVPVHIGDLVNLGVTKSSVEYCCFHFFWRIQQQALRFPFKIEPWVSEVRDKGVNLWFISGSWIVFGVWLIIVGVSVQPDRANSNHTDKKTEDGETERSAQGVGVRVGDWLRFIQAWKEFWVRSEVTSPCGDFGTWWWGSGSFWWEGFVFHAVPEGEIWVLILQEVQNGSTQVWTEELKLGLLVLLGWISRWWGEERSGVECLHVDSVSVNICQGCLQRAGLGLMVLLIFLAPSCRILFLQGWKKKQWRTKTNRPGWIYRLLVSSG